MRSRTRSAVVIAVAAALLSACSPAPSTAFSVNGDTMTTKQIDDATASCAAHLKVDPVTFRPQLALGELRGAVARAVAAKHGVEITSTRLDGVIDASSAWNFRGNAACLHLAQSLATFNLVINDVGEAQTIADAKQFDVVVNPMYGGWNPDHIAYTGESGSLSSRAGS